MQQGLATVLITNIMIIFINLAQPSCLGSSFSLLALSDLKFLRGVKPLLDFSSPGQTLILLPAKQKSGASPCVSISAMSGDLTPAYSSCLSLDARSSLLPPGQPFSQSSCPTVTHVAQSHIISHSSPLEVARWRREGQREI